jgi:uncharacterized protein YcaQ
MRRASVFESRQSPAGANAARCLGALDDVVFDRRRSVDAQAGPSWKFDCSMRQFLSVACP